MPGVLPFLAFWLHNYNKNLNLNLNLPLQGRILLRSHTMVCSKITNNVTTAIEVRSASARLFAGGAPWWVLRQHCTMLRLFFTVNCGIVRLLCAMRVFEVRASSSFPKLPLCQISFLSRDLHCWASPWRKIAYSITHPPSLFDAPSGT